MLKQQLHPRNAEVSPCFCLAESGHASQTPATHHEILPRLAPVEVMLWQQFLPGVKHSGRQQLCWCETLPVTATSWLFKPDLEVPNWSSPAKSHLPALDSLGAKSPPPFESQPIAQWGWLMIPKWFTMPAVLISTHLFRMELYKENPCWVRQVFLKE